MCSDSFDAGKFEEIVSKVEHVGDMHHAISAKFDLRSIMAVRSLIRKYKPDVVYCHSSKAGAIGRMANVGLRNRYGERNACLYNAHGWAFNMKGASDSLIKSYVMIEKMLAPITNSIICISEFEKNTALVHEICDPSKLTVIYNGIDLDTFGYMGVNKENLLIIGESEKKYTANRKYERENGRYVTFTNSVTGYYRLLSGEVDIFFGAGPSEKIRNIAKEEGKTLELIPIAKEAFVFFAEDKNPVDNLTYEEIRKIYSGE